MKYPFIKILILFFLFSSCKTNFVGKEFEYLENNQKKLSLKFLNDSILKVSQLSKDISDKEALYKYEILEKEKLTTIKKNQPTVNFKTKTQKGQFLQKIAITNVSGETDYFNKSDSLTLLKIKIENKITKRLYFNKGNSFIDL